MDLIKTETKPDLTKNSSQNDDIIKLKRKLEKYNEIVVERDELKTLCEEIELWKERFLDGHKRVFNELKTTCDFQLDMLKKSEDAEHVLNIKLRELQNINDCISNEMKSLRLDENNLKSNLVDNNQIIQNLTKDLCSVKSQLDEKNCEAEQLKMDLNSCKDKICDVVRELEYRTKERDQLNEDFKCIKIQLAEVKECATRMEENLTLELKTLYNELKNKGNILNELDIQYDKVKCELNNEKYRVKQLTENLVKLNKENEYDQIELKNELEVLKKENVLKENNIHNLKKKVEKLLRKHRHHVEEINQLKIELEEMKLQTKPLILSQERIEVENQTQNFYYDLETESISNKYTPNTSTTNGINMKTEINNLDCELKKVKVNIVH